MNKNILIAEDDKDIVDILILYLQNEKHNIFTAENGEEAYEIFKNNTIHICLFDIMMPKLNGYDLIKKIREESNVPIIILSAKNQDTDKIIGLNIGADDYITKPFNPLELVARVQATLRRNYDFNTEKIKTEYRIKDLTLNTESFTAYKNGEVLYLTPTELKILMLLMKEPGKIFTKVQIYENIIGDYFQSDDNTLMVHISRLREKIEDDPKNPEYIKTIRGLGYKIEKN
ncbi:MAG: response regulator transcription factor [Bacillota bacterium]|jgi:DNA-binding response OmpR family regulator|nr:response regulator transcription factor [Bacillota bacterium]NLP21761.1 response regulator transcription factor [Erysipelotrichaceae bacterium]